MTTLNSTLFPNLPDGIEAHQGFADEQAITAPIVLSTVQQIISDFGATSVTLASPIISNFM
jgi:hypothetical protein